MIAPHIVVGIGVFAISVLGFLKASHVIRLSNVLRRLAEQRGEEVALKRIRFCCVCAAIFGACLATGLIKPIKWL